MSKQVLSHLDLNSAAKVINMLDPTAAQDAATKAYVDSAVEGLAWKDAARVSTQGNLNLAAPGATIDGITMAANDRVLVRSQSTGAENGVYIWNGAATPATRAPDCDTAASLEQAVITVEEGTDAGATFRQTAVNFTLGSGTVTFTSFGTGAPSASETTAGISEFATQAEVDAGTDATRTVRPVTLAATTLPMRPRKHTAAFGDGAATQYDFTHNFGTRDLIVNVIRNSSPWDHVLCDIQMLDTNTVRLIFLVAPTSNLFRVVIVG